MGRLRRMSTDCIMATYRNCESCRLFNEAERLDCHGRPYTKIEQARRAANMTQKQLASASGLEVRRIQRIEAGEIDAGNVIAKNLLAIADALQVDPRKLI